MTEELKQVKLMDLRNEEQVPDTEVTFEKSVFGYNKKAVSDYIKVLKESLQNSEKSFNARIEEYAVMSSMLTQERDKYIKLIADAEAEKLAMQDKIMELGNENAGLVKKVDELSDSILNQDEIKVYEATILQNDELKQEIEELKAKMDEYERYKEENLALNTQKTQLELTACDLNVRIEEMLKHEISKEEFDVLTRENELIRQQYDEAMSSNSVLLAEKNVLVERCKRLEEGLTGELQKSRELREANTKIKLKTRKMIGELESRIYETGQHHRSNIEKITENINSVFHVLKYENADIEKLLKYPDSDLDDLLSNGSEEEQEDE